MVSEAEGEVGLDIPFALFLAGVPIVEFDNVASLGASEVAAVVVDVRSPLIVSNFQVGASGVFSAGFRSPISRIPGPIFGVCRA